MIGMIAYHLLQDSCDIIFELTNENVEFVLNLGNMTSENYFWWIRVPRVDLIYRSRRLYVPSPRPD